MPRPDPSERGWKAALALVACLSLAACTGDDPSPAPVASSSGTETEVEAGGEPRAEDARYLARKMRALHPDLFHWVSKERFDRAARQLTAAAPSLTDEEFLVEVTRLVALPTLGGRDGHAGLWPTHTGFPLHAYPFHFYDFSDGLYVVDAIGRDARHIGSRVLSVDGVPLDEIRRRLYPLITRDNRTTIAARFPGFLATAELLQGAGVTDGLSADFELRRPNGEIVHARVEAVAMHEYAEHVGHAHLWGLPADEQVLYLSNTEKSSWVRYLAGSRTVYVQYNLVESPEAIVDRVEKLIPRADRVVLDLRNNLGGDNTEYWPLVDLLRSRPLDERGKVYVIAGRTTFSAGGNLAGELAAETNAIFVGEPPGGSPNQFGDTQVIELPHSGIEVTVPVYFVEVVPDDDRVAIRPDIPVELSSEDYFEHRDPALEAILGRPAG